MAYVNMSHMPKPRAEYTVNFPALDGGLNLRDLEYRLHNDESPAMKNLLWREGVLCSRDGQESIIEPSSLGKGIAMYERLFDGKLVAHIGNYLYYTDPTASTPTWTKMTGANVGTNKGSFFHYFDYLYYKSKGHYVRIKIATGNTLTDEDVTGYVPVTVINASPTNGSGDLYQPENRISGAKTVWYNAESGVTDYFLPVVATTVDAVYVDGTEVSADESNPPAAGKYYYDSTNGKVIFGTAPPVTTPATNNTVQITYTKANSDAYNSVMDCPYATTYGGAGDLCVVMGGCPAQPNAIFWNGNNIAMDPSYFPMAQYQFCGDTDDAVTGFGKQQSFLVIFKEHSVGRVKQDTAEVDGRLTIDMPYTAINSKIGCDLPYTIQLIDNNLVWCNTQQGVHFLKDSSYAYENNIECISLKINGGPRRSGLLADVRSSVPCSLDTDTHYWICVNGEVWVWDYENTSYKEPSWYYFTNVHGVAFASELEDVWHLDEDGRLTHFSRIFEDYGESIDKSYRFAVQYFGGHDRLKNVNSVILVTRPDTICSAKLTYITDYETREDLTPLSHLIWRLVPRDLTYRCLAGIGFGAVFRRRPMCRRVKHFAMQLDNNVRGQDLSIVSAQIFYNFQGRLR